MIYQVEEFPLEDFRRAPLLKIQSDMGSVISRRVKEGASPRTTLG
jgi:hypothetical protein